MLNFRNDYSSGAHPAVLEALCRTNHEQTAGYGQDPYCAAAEERIRSLCRCPEAAVHFLVGGTQVNKTAIAAFLRPYEAVVAPETAHICVHETGAVEADGHRILSCPAPEGKLVPAALRRTVERHFSEHMVVPRLVYISNSTELGTVYTRQELSELSEACRELELYLYCDGARLGSAMAAGDTDLAHYAACCDAFTIGGTKNGLLFGEALVISNSALQPGFRHCMKRQGAVLAKGRLLGVQFGALLEDGLYLQLASCANRLAQRLAAALRELGVPMLADSPSNQIFPILPDAAARALAEHAAFEVQEKLDGERTCIRLVTAWDTREEDAEALLDLLKGIL